MCPPAAESPEELLERHWHGGVTRPPSSPLAGALADAPSQTNPRGEPEGPEPSSASSTPFALDQDDAAKLQAAPSSAAAPSAAPSSAAPSSAEVPGVASVRGRSPPGHWPLEVGINALLARAFFDVLRNPAAKALMQARCQRKLSLMKVPDYITSIRVVDVCMGTKPPTVFNCRAAPSPTDIVWPQGFFDFAYTGTVCSQDTNMQAGTRTGDLHLTIETSVDLREGAVWGQFDRAMAQLEGATGAGAVAAAGKAMAAAAKEAAAEEAHDSSSEGEEEGDPLDAAPGAAGSRTMSEREVSLRVLMRKHLTQTCCHRIRCWTCGTRHQPRKPLPGHLRSPVGG